MDGSNGTYLSSNRSSGWSREVIVSDVLTVAYGVLELTVNGEAELSEAPV